MPPLAFPLSMPFIGEAPTDVRIRQLPGRNRWRLFWNPVTPITYDKAFIIAVDGKQFAIAPERTNYDLRLEGTAGDSSFSATPIVEVIQIPSDLGDPGFFPDGWFSAILPNKIKVTFDPPADVSDVRFYNVYWDKGTGTIGFTDDDIVNIDPLLEDGSSSYEVWTPPLATGTFKFVVRAADQNGNESTTVAEFSQAISTFPGEVSNFSVSYSDATKKATLTWTDPSDIGSGTVKIFDNLGSITRTHPDYDTVVATVAAGVQTFTTAALTGDIWAFGIRAEDASSNRELNTNIIVYVRLDSSQDEVSGFPPRPFFDAFVIADGKVRLYAYVLPNEFFGTATKVQFFTNDGVGGAIDFGTPLSPGFVNLRQDGELHVADLETAVFGETARKFAAIAFTSSGVPGFKSPEITVTPDATGPSDPLSVATVTGRN